MYNLQLFKTSISRLNFKTILPSKSTLVGFSEALSSAESLHTSTANYKWNVFHLCKPPSLNHKLRRKVYFPEKYTVEPLKNDHLAGRDPNTGRVVTARIGGGVKHLFHWVDFKRIGPTEEGRYYTEKVLQIMDCGCRTAHIALVGSENQLRYILATVNMKAGDIIRTSMHIPKNAVLPNEGDAFPLGALPLETRVHNIERLPGRGGVFVHTAGAEALVMRKINKRVIVKLPSKLEVSFDEMCMATVGKLSNVEHKDFVLGTPWKHRELGRRPKSGLWHRKDGRFGRKIKPSPPVRVLLPTKRPDFQKIRITIPHMGIEYPKGYV